MTVPTFRSVNALTGEKSGVPALLAAADEISGQATELARLQAEVEQLRAGGAWVEHVERQRAMKRERDGECICNNGPDTEGPDEFCPWHGRRYNELVEGLESQAAEVERLHTELSRANRNVEMLTQQLDGMFEAHTRLQEVEAERDHFKALCCTYSDEVRSLNLQLESVRAGQPKRSGW